jgi:hypothetical protein
MSWAKQPWALKFQEAEKLRLALPVVRGFRLHPPDFTHTHHIITVRLKLDDISHDSTKVS